MVTYDRYQSSSAVQYLKRKNVNCGNLSVDKTTAPYYTYVSYLSSGKIKSGKNIILKNNIKSLQDTETRAGHHKVDHTKGKTVYEDGGDWQKSNMGKFAKDLADSHCGACYNLIQNHHTVPISQWEESFRDDKGLEKTKRSKKEKMLKEIEEKYGLILGDESVI